MKLGLLNMINAYKGSTPVSAAYLGNSQVWSSSQSSSYLQGLRVLVKDGANIAPYPATLDIQGTATYTGYEVQGISSSTVDATDLVRTPGSAITYSMWVKYGEAVDLQLYTGVTNTLLNLDINTGGWSRFRYYDNTLTLISDTIRPLAIYTGEIFIMYAITITDTDIKVYANMPDGINVDNTMRLLYTLPLSGINYVSGGIPRVRAQVYQYNKFAGWDKELDLATLQAWYDVGPIGNPEGIETGGVLIDNKLYNTVTIGSLEWMSENLASYQGGYMYPNNDIANVPEYGLLYSHSTALNLTPTGWRLPTLDDYNNLLNEIGQASQSVGTLNANANAILDDSQYWQVAPSTGNNSSGFSARGAGEVWGQDPNNGYVPDISGIKTQGVFHTNTPTGNGWYACFQIDDTSLSAGFVTEWVTIENSNRRNFSVRYVRDV